MQNIKINIHGFRFIEIETGYVAKPNRTAINRVPLSALIYLFIDARQSKTICSCIWFVVYAKKYQNKKYTDIVVDNTLHCI